MRKTAYIAIIGLISMLTVGCPPAPPDPSKPTANFNASPKQAELGQGITFMDNSSQSTENPSPIVSYFWNFGDEAPGNTSTEKNPTHTYAKSGKYTVTLTVTDENGQSNQKEQKSLITVMDPWLPLRTELQTNSRVGNKPMVADDSEVPLGVGYGVKFTDDGSDYQFETGQQLYDAPRDQMVAFDVGLQQVQDPDGRYTFITEQTWETRYLETYAEELDMKSSNISAKARFAAFTGGFDYGSASEKYAKSTHHEMLLKVHLDFGWFNLKNPQLLPGVLNGLKGSGFQGYGTHYAMAEHRFGELYLNIKVDTSYNITKETMSGNASASYNAVGTSASIKGAMDSFRQKIGGSSSMTVVLTTRGGDKLNLTFSDGTDYSNIVTAVNGWLATISSDKGYAREFYCRPITDLIPGGNTSLGSILAERRLQKWFMKFGAVDTTLSRLESILNFTNPPQIRQEFAYYNSTPYNAEYFYGLYLKYQTLYQSLQAEGNLLLNDPNRSFDPHATKWQAPTVEFPILLASFNMPTAYEDRKFAWAFPVFVTGGDFSNNGRYGFSWEPGNWQVTPTDCKAGVYDATTGATTVNVRIVVADDGYTLQNLFGNARGWQKMILRLTDLGTNKTLIRWWSDGTPI